MNIVYVAIRYDIEGNEVDFEVFDDKDVANSYKEITENEYYSVRIYEKEVKREI